MAKRTLRGETATSDVDQMLDSIESFNGRRKDLKSVAARSKFLPWNGNREELESAEINETGRVVKAGTPRFFVNSDQLIGVYRNGKGIARRLYASLKIPVIRDENDIRNMDRRRKIMAFRDLLKRQGIPGIA